jgi:nitroreductase
MTHQRKRREFLKLASAIGAGFVLPQGAMASEAAGAGAKTGTMKLFEAIEKRVSVRRFRKDAVPKEDLEKILRCAQLAPNSGNQQACRFLVVDSRKILDDFMQECIREREAVLKGRGEEVPPIEVLKGYFEHAFAAPVFILVLVDKNVKYKGYTDKDGALAAGWILLAARALGYGSVFFTDSIPEEICRSFFKIPERYSRTCIIPIGVPLEWPDRPARKKLEEVVFYNALE